MKRKITLLPALLLFLFLSCNNDDGGNISHENPANFQEVGSLDLGDTGASEITAFDPKTKRLFVVNNSSTSVIDVIDLSKPSAPVKLTSIDISSIGGGVNSVAVYDGVLASAIEGFEKTDNGKVALFNCKTLEKITEVTAGALPDMVTFSPDGKYILSANEGEPNADYSNDPVGSVSIISVKDNYTVTTLDFSRFNGEQAALMAKGFRVFGPGADLAQDVEPEYITVSPDSKTAYVTLQENNAIAKVSLTSKTITNIYPLGFKDYSKSSNALDPSDKEGAVNFRSGLIKGMYLPDAIASFQGGHETYLITVNEGDTRDYDTFGEEERIMDLDLDPRAFPNAAELKKPENFGRLKVTSTMGKNSQGQYSTLYSFGARSFSLWNTNGKLIFDSGNDVEKRTNSEGLYDDDRSDDKGVEPEGVAVGKLGSKTVAFVGLERADAVLLYDISDVNHPKFIKLLKTGDAPEGILFIPKASSPNGKSMLVVSSEEDGVIKIFQP